MESQNKPSFDRGVITSIYYHDIFDYPLTREELIRWKTGKKHAQLNKRKRIISKMGFYFLEGRKNIVCKKILRQRISKRKNKIAYKKALILAKIPTVLGIFITGNLAMNNAKEGSDIDLMIITKSGSLWFTRLISYVILALTNSETRKYGDKNQKDKLCLNIWLDETALLWNKKDRNIYTAHEIAQTKPIIDKSNIYQRFLQNNSWILDYWPNSVNIEKKLYKTKIKRKIYLLEKICYRLQYLYMKKKITREKISLHYAIFHPNNLSKNVFKKLSS